MVKVNAQEEHESIAAKLFIFYGVLNSCFSVTSCKVPVSL